MRLISGSAVMPTQTRTYFWRHIFDQKFAQATSNAYLLFVKMEMLFV